jgi:DNA replication initiation complex subunit (GINS family)
MPDHYTQLLEWRRSESGVRGLAKLPSDFYAATEAYLSEVRRTFESELRENPSGRKGDLARQTHHRAAQIARDIIEARVTKILSQAFQASVGGSRDLTNALPEERTLFDRLVEVLRDHRERAAPFLDSVGPPTAAAGTTAKPPKTESTPPPRPAAAPDRGHAPAATVLVRVLQDGRPIEVGAETIDLRKEDVLSLPPETARLLISAKVAEMILPGPTPPVT